MKPRIPHFIVLSAATVAVTAIAIVATLRQPTPERISVPIVPQVGSLSPSSTPAPSLIPTPTPTPTPTASVTPTPSISAAVPAVSKGLEKFSQLVVDNLKLGEDRLTPDDLATASFVITAVWNKRAEWREAIVSNPAIAGTDLEVLIGKAATQRGYIIRQPISVALQSALKAAVMEWWNNNYERQFVPPDPY